MVKRKEDIRPTLCGEYRRNFYITARMEEIADPKLIWRRNFQPEKINSNPNGNQNP